MSDSDSGYSTGSENYLYTDEELEIADWDSTTDNDTDNEEQGDLHNDRLAIEEEVQEERLQEEQVGPSFNRFNNYTVRNPFTWDPYKHYGPDVQSPYHKKLIERFNSYDSGRFKYTAQQLLNIWEHKSSNEDVMHMRPTNYAILPGNPHVGPGNPIYYKSYNALDDIARNHDIAYSNAQSPLDIYKADKEMLRKLEETPTDAVWPWIVKQIATYGIKFKHQFELQWGVLYPKFSKEQVAFMKENYPEYKQIMGEVEERNRDMTKALSQYDPLVHSRFWTHLSPSSNNTAGKIKSFMNKWGTKVNNYGLKVSQVWQSGAVWKDPYLRDQQQWAERYHEQLESSYINNPEHSKEMIKMHLGFYKEREAYWQDRLYLMRESPWKQNEQQFHQLKTDMDNLDDIEYKALVEYMNRDDRGWGHAFSYDIYWDLTEYHNNQFKHWLKQTYDAVNKSRSTFLEQPLLNVRGAEDKDIIKPRTERALG